MENTVPFLSVIVPAYNVENYIRQCVDSILAQTFTDFELLLVDDGAKDSTGKICDEYALKDARIRVIHKKNGGLVSARKAGITEAKGEYAAYVDGDDWVAEEMFENLCTAAKKENADIVISDFMIARESSREPLTQNMEAGCYDKQALLEQIYPRMLCNGEYFSFGFQPSLCSKLFRRTILTGNQMAVADGIKLGEDAACTYPCMLQAEKVVYLKGGYYYYYRMRETSISHAIVRSFYTEEIITLIKHLQERFFSEEEYCESMQGQLWLYACYMFDNMITPCISWKNLFFCGRLQKELEAVGKTVVGKEITEYGKRVRTSSRMKRILRVIEEGSLTARINLYLFRIYEKVKE